MLRKIWNTLLHGESRTKRFLISVIGLGLATVGCLVGAIMTHSPLFWVASVASGLITAAVTRDAVLVVSKDNTVKKVPGKKAAGGRTGGGDVPGQRKEKKEEKSGKKEKEKPDSADTVRKEPDRKESGSQKEDGKKPDRKEAAEKEPGGQKAGQKKPDRKEAAGKESGGQRSEEKKPDRQKADRKESGRKEDDGKEPDTQKAERKKAGKKEKDRKKTAKQETEEEALAREEEDEEEFSGNALANMTESKLNKLLVRYKVKQEHVPVVIDLCVSERVKQCPGFAWVAGGSLKILLVESKPRLIDRPCHALQVLEVERGIGVRASNEYTELRKTELMNLMFTPYLPRYHKKTIGGRTVLLKNLYVLDGDMKFSSGSVNGLRKLLPLRIELNDRRMQGQEAGPYSKELFLTSFLWQDGILTLKDYQKEVEQTLESMAVADISYNEFEKELSEMIRSGLLPAEYRKFAYAKREERKAEKVEKDGGKSKKKGRKERRA